MAAYSNDAFEDAALGYKDNANEMTVCAGQPTNRTEAISTFMLATTTPVFDPKTTTATPGREMTTQQASDVPITNPGDADHIAYVDATTLLYVHTCTTQTLTAGGTVTIPAHSTEVAKPVSV